MCESGYYPPGAEFDPHAPYNEIEPEMVPVTFRLYGDLYQDVTIEIPEDADPREYVKEAYSLVKVDKWVNGGMVDFEIL